MIKIIVTLIILFIHVCRWIIHYTWIKENKIVLSFR